MTFSYEKYIIKAKRSENVCESKPHLHARGKRGILSTMKPLDQSYSKSRRFENQVKAVVTNPYNVIVLVAIVLLTYLIVLPLVDMLSTTFQLAQRDLRATGGTMADVGKFTLYYWQRLLASDLSWNLLFKPLLKKVLPAISPQAAAMLQTTVGFTMQKGSEGYNVIPQEAWVTANLRFIPHQKSRDSIHVLEHLAAKYGLETEVLNAMDPSPSLDLRGRAFRLTEAAIGRTFPGLPASPYVVTGATDCRFYTDVCDSCVRFSPVIYGPEQMKGMHGLDENIETNCLPGAVDYYKNIIKLQEEF